MTTTGEISGTPTQMGSYSFQAQVTDAANQSTSTNFSMQVTGPPPSLSGITPTSGSTSGGTAVTISGKNLQSGATVTFGGVAGTSVDVASSSQMTAVTPAHAAGSVDVTVTNPSGESATLAAAFGYGNAPPSVSAISPNSGPTTGGTAVNITGANFILGAVVLFGTAQASSVAVTSPTQIQAVSPAGSGTIDVIVKNPDGQTGTLSGGFTYSTAAPGAPTISSLSPNSGPDGSQTLIDGSNFASGATISFGGTAASSVQFVNTNQLAATVPSIPTGAVDVTVNDPGGASTTLASGFTVTTPQSLLSGCTVDANNNPSCPIPSGWTLAAAQGFESGSVPSSQTVNGASIASGFAHTGSYAEDGTYAGDGNDVYWMLNPGQVNSREVYVSWWEFDQSQGRMNDEMFLMRPFILDSSGALLQEDIIDWFPGPNRSTSNTGFNALGGQMVMEPQSNTTGLTTVYYGTVGNIPWGTWTQWEVHFKANDPGQTNGELEVYENGNLFMQQTGMNFNGSVDMTGQGIEIGGVYTKLTWMSGSSCGSFLGDGLDNGPRVTDFSKPCPCANQCPANGYVPIFQRYFDDIIVLKK